LGRSDQGCQFQSIGDDISQTETRPAHYHDHNALLPETVASQVEEEIRCHRTEAPDADPTSERQSEGVREAAAPAMLVRHSTRLTSLGYAREETTPDPRRNLDEAELSLAMAAFNSCHVDSGQDADPLAAFGLPASYNDASSDTHSDGRNTPLVATAFFEVAGEVSVATERRDELDMDFEEEVIALYRDAANVEDIAIDIERLTSIYEWRRNAISDALCLAQGQLQLRLEACREGGIDPEDYRYRRCFIDATW